jgi:hypothetical protein
LTITHLSPHPPSHVSLSFSSTSLLPTAFESFITSYNKNAASPSPPSAINGAFFPAAPVNCEGGADPVAPGIMPPLTLLIVGLVPLPAAHEGTTTPERVTITSAAADGQPLEMVMVEVAFWLGSVRWGCVEGKGMWN